MGVTLGQWRGAIGNESLTSERKAKKCLLERSGWVGWAGPRGVGLYWVGLGWMAQVGWGGLRRGGLGGVGWGVRAWGWVDWVGVGWAGIRVD